MLKLPNNADSGGITLADSVQRSWAKETGHHKQWPDRHVERRILPATKEPATGESWLKQRHGRASP